MHFTDDPAPPLKEDVQVSPSGRPVFDFGRVDYLGETAPGRHSFLSSYTVPRAIEPPVAFRIAAKSEIALMTIATIDDGLELSGIDRLESYQTFRLQNRGLPRVVFGDDA